MPESILPKLDERLAALARAVRPGVRVADIGTDHGYLMAYLAASGKIVGGAACDINKKPLEKAAFSLCAAGAADRVRTVLCDGLSGVFPEECDDIVIAGMGGDLIWKILDAAAWTRNERYRFVLQPMTKSARLRERLYENGFALLREDAVLSGHFPYSVMCAAYTGKRYGKMDPLFALTGLVSSAQEDVAATAYREKVARLLIEKADGLRRQGRAPQALSDCEELLRRLQTRAPAEPPVPVDDTENDNESTIERSI